MIDRKIQVSPRSSAQKEVLREKALVKKIFTFGILLSLISVYKSDYSDTPYYILLAFSLFAIASITISFISSASASCPKPVKIKGLGVCDRAATTVLSYIWIGIIFSWVYGATLGIINQAPLNFVFRNFIGLLLYMMFPIFIILRPPPKSLISCVIIAGIIQSIFGISELVSAILINPYLLLAQVSLGESRSFYSIGLVVIFPLFSLSAANLLLPRFRSRSDTYAASPRLFKSFTFFGYLLLALIVPAMSKGFILATTAILLFMIFVSLVRIATDGFIRLRAMFYIFIIFAGMASVGIIFQDLLIFSYGSEEFSNSVRSEQYNYLKDELDFVGHGLGSSLTSGYVRSDNAYGLELNYLNIVHKLGIFSIFLFLSYFLTICVAATRIIRNLYVLESAFVFGLMGFLIVGIGNPILLSATTVTLHVIGLYLLVRPTIGNRP